MFPYLLALLTTFAAPSDWPCWRGPQRDGVSTETAWLSDGSAAPLWRRNVGWGHSGPTLQGGRLYTLGFVDTHDLLWCLDAETGAVLWSHPYPATRGADQHEGGTLSTPVIDGERLYISHRTGMVRCHSARTGKPIWRRRLRPELDELSRRWGLGGSPLVLDDRLIVNSGATFALDKNTGEVLWKSRPLEALYSTPQELTLNGTRCVAVFAQSGLAVLNAEDGEALHFYPWHRSDPHVNASTPVLVGEERVLISSGYSHGAALVDLSGATPKAVWETRALNTVLSSCVVLGERIYGFDQSILKCFDLGGEEVWRQRGLGMGALTAAGDRLILLNEDGELVVGSVAGNLFEELSRTVALEGAHNWTSPVLSGGRIYCRNGKGDLVCFDRRP